MTNNNSTSYLNNLLNNTTNIKSFINDNYENFESTPFHIAFSNIIDKKELVFSEILRASNVAESTGYQLREGRRNPSRDKVLQLCIGANLSLEESNYLLKCAGKSSLYVKDIRDAILIYCINHSISFIDVNIMLENESLPFLGKL
ncbi:MAG: XRE family transcriptional regulator [Clostridia bacterium]|nr:XRE family transcriptional regulator [Clostridia bacterium]